MAGSSLINFEELGNKIQDIFPMPQILKRILQAVNDPNASAATIETIFKYEPSLTLKILSLANSAYFGCPEKITNIRAAITLLGLNLIKSLAIHASVNELFRFGTMIPCFSGYELWKHSVGVAVGAKMISRRSQVGTAEDFFTLGILHDIGLIIEYQFYRETFLAILSRLQEPGQNLIRLEKESLGADHAEIAGFLCQKWNMPETITRILEFHHSPLAAPEIYRKPAAVLYLGDQLAHRKNFGFSSPADPLQPEILSLIAWSAADWEAANLEFDHEILEMTIFLQ